MKIFSESEAKYYCSKYAGSSGDAEKSISEFITMYLKSHKGVVAEGTSLFQEFCDCSLRAVERWIFFAASHYRRSLDLMISSSSPWAHITLYYGSWYASRALLGMFGCQIFSPYLVVDVHKGTPGNLELRVRKIGKNLGQMSTTYRGTHRIYWDLFYRAALPLKTIIKPHLATVLSPISGDPVWQIQNRNEINYNSYISIQMARNFEQSFTKSSFPACLPGAMGTQYRILESLLELVFTYADDFHLGTDALKNFSSTSLRKKIRSLVYNVKAPSLVRRSKKSMVT